MAYIRVIEEEDKELGQNKLFSPLISQSWGIKSILTEFIEEHWAEHHRNHHWMVEIRVEESDDVD